MNDEWVICRSRLLRSAVDFIWLCGIFNNSKSKPSLAYGFSSWFLILRFLSLFAELEMDTEDVVEMEGQQTILKSPISLDKMDR